MSKLPLVEGVLNYVRENNVSFCTPGHKQGRGFLSTDIGKELADLIINCDITEVDGLDNLHNAEGIIKEAENLLSQLYNSKESHFLVNGSTSGNLIMIFSALQEGDKVIVDRNCHKSIYNGIILRKLNPIYVENKFHKEFNLPVNMDMKELKEAVEQNKDAKAIILTYPNYYGIACDIKSIVSIAKENNMYVLVDSAHGAHYGVHEKLPTNSVASGADMVVMSCHKTLSSFTQTSYLHIINSELIDKAQFYFKMFNSTSPSYMLMASMDYARYYLGNYGQESYNDLIILCNKYKEKLKKLKYLRVLEDKDLLIYQCNLDATRYTINFKNNVSANLVLNYLRKNHIQAEMSDLYNIVLIFSPFNTEGEFQYLYEVLSKMPYKEFYMENVPLLSYKVPKVYIAPYETLKKNKELIKIENSEGHICGESIIPYPPGVPILMAGELIDKEAINVIKYYIKNNIQVIGIQDGYIKVINM